MIRKHKNPFRMPGFYLWLFLAILVPIKGISSSPEFSSFKIILERNIFDSDRRPFRENSDRSKPRPNPQQTDRFVLLGVLIHNENSLAFFEGSQKEYRKEFRPGESIAGYRITDISTVKVTLEKKGRQIPLLIGQGMSSTDGEDWSISMGTSPGMKDDSLKNVPPVNPEKNKGKDANADDLLKKMMERREKESSQ